MCSALSVFHLVAVCLLISLMYCRCSAFRFLTVCLRSLFFLISDCLLISLMCSGFFAFCFIMVCLLIPLMCSKVFAFHFLKEHSSIFLTCSGSSFIFLAAWFFLSLVVLLLMQLLCGKLPFSLFLNFSSASICIPLCSFFVSFTLLPVINWTVFICILCTFAVVCKPQSSTFYCKNVMNLIQVPNVNIEAICIHWFNNSNGRKVVFDSLGLSLTPPKLPCQT